MKNITKSAGLVAAIVTLACAGAANANSISGSVGGAPTGVNYLNFDDLTPGTSGTQVSTGPNGSVTVTLNPDAQVASGTTGTYAAPYLSNDNGVGFGPGGTDQANGPDATPYLTSGKDGSGTMGKITLTFATPQLYFGLLWGSIDDYNTITFMNGATQVGQYTGSDALASPSGDQGVNGTLYVNINLDSAYTSVVITSTQYAFELDNVSYNGSNVSVPDGGLTIALLGFALVSVEGLRRKFAA